MEVKAFILMWYLEWYLEYRMTRKRWPLKFDRTCEVEENHRKVMQKRIFKDNQVLEKKENRGERFWFSCNFPFKVCNQLITSF